MGRTLKRSCKIAENVLKRGGNRHNFDSTVQLFLLVAVVSCAIESGGGFWRNKDVWGGADAVVQKSWAWNLFAGLTLEVPVALRHSKRSDLSLVEGLTVQIFAYIRALPRAQQYKKDLCQISKSYIELPTPTVSRKRFSNRMHCTLFWNIASSGAKKCVADEEFFLQVHPPPSPRPAVWLCRAVLVRFQWLGFVCLYRSTGGILGCDMNSTCAASCLSQTALIFASQVLNKKLDAIGDDNVLQAALKIFKEMNETDLSCRFNVLETSAGS